MIFHNGEQRRHKRYQVCWPALIAVRFENPINAIAGAAEPARPDDATGGMADDALGNTIDGTAVDTRGWIVARIANFSALGALIQAPGMMAMGRNLLVSPVPPDLSVRMDTPGGRLETPIEIRWYRWSVEQVCYEIGVAFRRAPPGFAEAAHQLIRYLKKQGAPLA